MGVGPPRGRDTRCRTGLRKLSCPTRGHIFGDTPTCLGRRGDALSARVARGHGRLRRRWCRRPTPLRISGGGGWTCSGRRAPRTPAGGSRHHPPCRPSLTVRALHGCGPPCVRRRRRGRSGTLGRRYPCLSARPRTLAKFRLIRRVGLSGTWRGGSGLMLSRPNGFGRTRGCPADRTARPCVAFSALELPFCWLGCGSNLSVTTDAALGPPLAWPCVALACIGGSSPSHGRRSHWPGPGHLPPNIGARPTGSAEWALGRPARVKMGFSRM